MISKQFVEEEWLKVVNVEWRGRTEAIFTPRQFLEVERLDENNLDLYVNGDKVGELTET